MKDVLCLMRLVLTAGVFCVFSAFAEEPNFDQIVQKNGAKVIEETQDKVAKENGKNDPPSGTYNPKNTHNNSTDTLHNKRIETGQ